MNNSTLNAAENEKLKRRSLHKIYHEFTPSPRGLGLNILTNSHRDIRQLRKETGNAELHGNKFWTATYVLMDYLK